MFASLVGDDFMTHRWKPGYKYADKVLFSLGVDNKYSIANFETFSQKNSRDRLRLGRSKSRLEVVKFLYDKYVSETLMQYEEQQLDKKYPEFKALMREYEEGILLFEATKILVWDKASQDSTGLEQYFATHKKHFHI